MAHQNEAKIVESSTSRLDKVFSDVVPNDGQIKVSGLVMGGYRFPDDSRPFKIGNVFLANKQERIQFSLRAGQTLDESIGKESARFLVRENNELSTMENVMRMGFKLKHIGILKPIFVAQKYEDSEDQPEDSHNLQVGAQNPQVGAQNLQVGDQNLQVEDQNLKLPKVVAGFSSYDQSFDNWLGNQVPQGRKSLCEEEKQMLRTAYAAINEMWCSGYTCDNLADPASYVMIGWRIKILPHLCRPKDQNDIDFMLMRNALADLLHNNIAQFWIVPGLQDFILLLRNQIAGSEDIFGHPILLNPGRRQLVYRGFGTRTISSSKLIVLNSKIQFSTNWKISSPHSNQVLDSICSKHNFSQDVKGALLFTDKVSRHYVQHLKDLKKEDWYNHIKDDTVDTSLEESVPGLLSKRYGLDFDTEFLSAS